MFRSRADEQSEKRAEEAIARVGGDLRRVRVKRGERIEDVAAYLEIKSTYLFGIEQGDMSIIPSRRRARAYLSSYANYLGLNGDAITDRLNPVMKNLKGAKGRSGILGRLGLDRISAGILTTSILTGVVIGWSYLGDTTNLDLIASPVTANVVEEAGEDEAEPDEIQVGQTRSIIAATGGNGINQPSDELSEAEQALAQLESQVVQEQAAAGNRSITGFREQGDQPTSAATQVAALGNGTAGAAPSPKQELPANVLATLVAERGDGAKIYEPENTDARVIVRALSTSWIQVSSGDRAYLWTRTMQPREMLLVPNRDDLELWAGDASGVEILLDGVILPPLGPPGTVVRGVALAPASLEALSETVSLEGGKKPTF